MDWFQGLLKNKTGVWWGMTFKSSRKLIGAITGKKSIKKQKWQLQRKFLSKRYTTIIDELYKIH